MPTHSMLQNPRKLHRFRIALTSEYFRTVEPKPFTFSPGTSPALPLASRRPIDELVDAAGFIDNDRFHDIPPYVPNYPDAFHHPGF